METRLQKKSVVLFAVFVGVLLIILALILFYSSSEKAGNDTLAVNERHVQSIVTETISADTDGDGLKDWEEILFKTDPRNPDTDGDGTSDGDEVDQKRNPLVKGPGDEDSNTISGGIDRKKIEELPDTEKLAFKLFEGYIDLKQGRYLGTNIEKNFITGLVADSIPSITYTLYEEVDISLSNATGKEGAEAYQKSLEAAWRPLYDIKEDELITFARIVDNGDTTGFRMLSDAKGIYEQTIAQIQDVSSPRDAVSIHLDILNAFSIFVGVLNTMITVKDDPLVALTAVNGYTESEVKIKSALSRLNTYYLVNGIVNGI